MIWTSVWLSVLRLALVTIFKKVANLFKTKNDKSRTRKCREWWFDFDLAKMRFKGGCKSHDNRN